MSFFKTIFLSNQTKTLLNTRTPFYRALPFSRPFLIRTQNYSPQIPPNKPLSVLFREAVGLAEKSGENETENESEGEKDRIMRSLMDLEKEVRKLNETKAGKKREKRKVEREKPKNVSKLVELFGGERREKRVVTAREKKKGEVVALKDMSELAEVFVRHLYEKGYFNKANFLVDNKLDFGYFDSAYGRDFIKHAAFEFGRDHQDIAKWLSGKHLKNVVLFGCPSLDKNNVFAAKRLRKFFKIQENTVCSQCTLKNSCRFVNADAWGAGTRNLLLVDVMKVITLYVLHQVPPKLVVPDELKDSVELLLRDIIKLSQSVLQS